MKELLKALLAVVVLWLLLFGLVTTVIVVLDGRYAAAQQATADVEPQAAGTTASQ